MPTYQYRCAKCGEQFEAWQSIHDDALTVHDGDCGGPLAKVMAVGGIVLKGPGFYRTDSRSKPRDGDAKSAESTSGNGAGDKAGGTAGGKPEKSDKKDTKPADTPSKPAPSKP